MAVENGVNPSSNLGRGIFKMEKQSKNYLKKIKKIILIILASFLGLILLWHIIYYFLVPDTIPDKIPAEMQKVIDKFNNESSDNLDFLKKAYDFVDARYTSPTKEYLRQPGKLFVKDIDTIWNTPGYSPCDKQNYLVKVMLVKSGRFNESDVKLMLASCGMTPHYYLRVKLNSNYLDIDMWGAEHNYPFGSHASFPC